MIQSGLINLKITDVEIASILNEAEFKNYRFDGALEWITKALELVRELS